jgi:CRP/FNR family cyclic AMP-dependent transcriptional regulator
MGSAHSTENYEGMSVPKSILLLPLKTIAPGEFLMQQGSPKGAVYFLASGILEVSKDGVPITRVREPGAMFGEMAVFLNTSHTATVAAVTEVKCHVAADPESFFASNTDVVVYIATTLARRLDSLNRYLLDVKAQYADRNDHLGMVDEVLDALMMRHPRTIAPPRNAGQ